MRSLASIKADTLERLHDVLSGANVAALWHPDATINAVHPFNFGQGHAAIEKLLTVLKSSLAGVERRDSVFVAGRNFEDSRMQPPVGQRLMIAAMGVLQGTFVADLLGIPATHGLVHLRFCEAHHLDGGMIRESWIFLDFPDLMRQAGCWPLMPSLGAEGMWPGPARADGVRPDHCDPDRGAVAFSTVMAMHDALLSFDGRNLESMRHDQFWTKDFLWYGPAGIGMTRGMNGFRAHHQMPFLTGFPDRRGSGHFIRVGDGDFVVTGGWPSVQATHSGEWLGLPPTGKNVDFRVMDFYCLDGDRIAENWVPIDIIWVLKQMGSDVFARLRHLQGQRLNQQRTSI